jgi:hypothetical protein
VFLGAWAKKKVVRGEKIIKSGSAAGTTHDTGDAYESLYQFVKMSSVQQHLGRIHLAVMGTLEIFWFLSTWMDTNLWG